jgi:hypothetical protein
MHLFLPAVAEGSEVSTLTSPMYAMSSEVSLDSLSMNSVSKQILLHHDCFITVCTQNEQEPEAPARNRANRTIRFGKLDGPVSSAPTAIKGTIGSSEGILLLAKWRLTRGAGQDPRLPAKWRLTRGRDKIHDNSRSCGGN